MRVETSGSVLIPAARVAAVVPQPQPQRKALAFAILCLGCFIAFLDIQIVSASIEEIGGGLAASLDDMSWVQTSYLIGDIIMIPLAAWLSRVLSTRWLVTIGATGFTLASMLCGMAWDVRSMIVFRALEGLFGGVMIPTAFTAAVVLFAGKQKAVAASCVSAAAGLAPTLGPVIGGWITDDWSWHLPCHRGLCRTSRPASQAGDRSAGHDFTWTARRSAYTTGAAERPALTHRGGRADREALVP
jgi:MFS transporter, DHA2 family, multidrug resistance protein